MPPGCPTLATAYGQEVGSAKARTWTCPAHNETREPAHVRGGGGTAHTQRAEESDGWRKAHHESSTSQNTRKAAHTRGRGTAPRPAQLARASACSFPVAIVRRMASNLALFQAVKCALHLITTSRWLSDPSSSKSHQIRLHTSACERRAALHHCLPRSSPSTLHSRFSVQSHLHRRQALIQAISTACLVETSAVTLSAEPVL